MISKASPSECYVYITLPGQVSAVTAGRFVLEKNARGDALGRFVYGRSYLENQNAVELDPVEPSEKFDAMMARSIKSSQMLWPKLCICFTLFTSIVVLI